MSKGFKKIYYNNKTNRIFLWETGLDGKTKKEAIYPDIEYYIPDKSKKSKIKDIWGNPVIKQTSKKVSEMRDFVKTSGVQTCESSMAEDVKFLQKRYADSDLEVDMNDFQVATLDIELEIDSTPPPFAKMTKEATYKINCLTIHYSKTDETFTFGIRPYTGDSPLQGLKNPFQTLPIAPLCPG